GRPHLRELSSEAAVVLVLERPPAVAFEHAPALELRVPVQRASEGPLLWPVERAAAVPGERASERHLEHRQLRELGVHLGIVVSSAANALATEDVRALQPAQLVDVLEPPAERLAVVILAGGRLVVADPGRNPLVPMALEDLAGGRLATHALVALLAMDSVAIALDQRQQEVAHVLEAPAQRRRGLRPGRPGVEGGQVWLAQLELEAHDRLRSG